jgi:hypothetical protein
MLRAWQRWWHAPVAVVLDGLDLDLATAHGSRRCV